MTMMSRKPDALREPAEVLKAFKLFEIPAIDKEKAGYVRQSSLIHALSNLSGEKLSRSEATELLSQMPAPNEKGFPQLRRLHLHDGAIKRPCIRLDIQNGLTFSKRI